MKWVYNRFSGKRFLAKCGQCKSCMQEKAMKKAGRIKNEYDPNKIVLFVTLTYDRCSCPFIKQSDLDNRVFPLPIYREFTTRRTRTVLNGQDYYFSKRHYGEVKIDQLELPDYEKYDDFPHIKHLKFRSRNIGICYFPDVQNFKKRLAINLKRIYHYEKPYKVYACMEYGGTTSRPHAHLCIHIPEADEPTFRAAILEAWPYAHRARTARGIEVARDVASYVASYVSKCSHLHPFLSDNFKAKSSFSKDYGLRPKLFSLDSILLKIEGGDMSYLRAIGPKGREVYTHFSIPKYVINRYFPIFKGYSKLSDTEVYDFVRNAVSGSRTLTWLVKDGIIHHYKLSTISYEDMDKIRVRLVNAYDKFFQATKHKYPWADFVFDDFAWYYLNSWKVYKATNLRLWYNDKTIPVKYKYDNSVDLLDSDKLNQPVIKAQFDSMSEPYIKDANYYPENIRQTYVNEGIFNFRSKEKEINNFVMAQKHYYF